jgi:hypothetical protein
MIPAHSLSSKTSRMKLKIPPQPISIHETRRNYSEPSSTTTDSQLPPRIHLEVLGNLRLVPNLPPPLLNRLPLHTLFTSAHSKLSSCQTGPGVPIDGPARMANGAPQSGPGWAACHPCRIGSGRKFRSLDARQAPGGARYAGMSIMLITGKFRIGLSD